METIDYKSFKLPVEHKCNLCSYATRARGDYNKHVRVHSNERPFKCPDCPYRAKSKGHIKIHQNNVHLFLSPSSRPFPCQHPGCNYRGKQKSNLNTHSKIHSEEKPLFCSHPNCTFATNQKGRLPAHTQIHTGEKPFACPFESCSFATGTQSRLVNHTRTHTKERPFKCPEENCNYSAAQKQHVKLHQLNKHPKEGEERPSFSCPICEYKGKTKSNLFTHIKRHTLEKLFKCDEPNCNFEGRLQKQVERHKVVHSDEKPFACSLESCRVRCKSKGSLSTHLKNHSAERCYKCELCPYRGKTQSVVVNHLKYVHSDPNFRPFKCTEKNCDLAFKTKGVLTQHLLIHTREKKYMCAFPGCDFQAVKKFQVVHHEYNIHSEKKDKCPICHVQCKTKCALETHFRTHTNEKPYFCKASGCKSQAKTASALSRHQKRNHPYIFKEAK